MSGLYEQGEKPIQIIIVSGFLGAGKTTWIEQWIKHQTKQQKIAIIENDFGDKSLDATILRSLGGIEVREMSNGCICCSLHGDFSLMLHRLLKEVDPDVLIVEPSGVAKIESTLKPLEALRCCSPVVVTILDGKYFDRYHENFSDFYVDQILHADHILINYIDDITEISQTIRDLGYRGSIDQFDVTDPTRMITPFPSKAKTDGILDGIKVVENRTCHDHTHIHGDARHNHSTNDALTHYSFIPKAINADDLGTLEARLKDSNREILRAKGILEIDGAFFMLQMTPTQFVVETTSIHEPQFTLIAKDINRSDWKDFVR